MVAISKTAKAVLSVFVAITLTFWGFSTTSIQALADTLSADTVTVQGTSSEGDSIDGVTPTSNELNAVFHYRDSYFFQDSHTYNPSLATMSGNLARAAYDIGDTEADFPIGYQNLETLLEDCGFTNFEANEGYKIKPESDSIGVGIAMKNATVNGERRTIIAIGVRGGNYGAEWSGNTKLSDSGEAQGFATARDQVIAFLNQYLSAHESEITEQPRIWIAGFSRASATSNLTMNFINYAIENCNNPVAAAQATGIGTASAAYSNMYTLAEHMARLKANQSNMYCYGFEVPAGGVKKGEGGFNAVADDNGNIWNAIHSEDVVPMVAPSSWDFVRYGTDVNLVEETTISGTEYSSVSLDAFYE